MTDQPTATDRSVIVAGDVMIDWNLTVDRDISVAARSWKEAGKVRRLKQFGGAWLLADLVKQFAKETPFDGRVIGVAQPQGGTENEIHQTYSVIAPASDNVWRIQEFLGVERVGDGNLRVTDDQPNADIVVLLDSDLGFDENAKAWPAAITTPGHKPWIIFKTSVPAFQGALWQHLITYHAQRLIVVTTVDDLRRKEIQLLRRLSWERTAQDLVSEMRERPALRALHPCQHVIISFGTAGAMLLSRDEKPRLVFDRSSMEGEWEPPKKGSMIGYTTVLAAAVTHEVMIHSEFPQLADALTRGISGMRALFENGYGKDAAPSFSNEKVVETARKARRSTSTAAVMEAESASWTILGDRLHAAAAISPDRKVDDVLYELAARVAIYGPDEALGEVPQLRIGKLFTVDREEIESLRSVKGLLAEYINRKPSKPFSIAVFGSPGSGKSFGVEEIAKDVGGDRIQILTFNLTQFTRSEELHGAFHQVRDVSLRGKIPVVFWDEFDTTYGDKPLGWMRYFIGPMQDGLFQEDQVTHPIGTSIFVFAGGTAATKDEFVAPPMVDPNIDRKALKVPDFISRLKGFLNVTGPNRRDAQTDPHYLIRRAILLRSMIEKHCPDLFQGKKQILQIDPGVLHAFLNTESYRHGARSLESVIAMSTLAGRKHFDSSSLPPEHQMELHVQIPFEDLAHEFRFTYDVVRLEQLAAIAHEEFCTVRKDNGWTLGPVRDDGKKIHNLLGPYAELPEWEKEANRATVRWIPNKIATKGYAMAPAGSGVAQTMTAQEIEELAEMEHKIWMDRKLAAGYVKGPVATESPKQSPYLVSWTELPDESKLIDRGLITAIPRILAKAGYILVKQPKALG